MRYDNALHSTSDLLIEQVVSNPHRQERYLRLAEKPEPGPETPVSDANAPTRNPRRCVRSVDEIVKALLPKLPEPSAGHADSCS